MTHEEMIAKVIEYFEENNDEFIETIESLDSWNGYLGEDRVYPMYELNDLFCGCSATELLEKLSDDFRVGDEYFKDGIYGLESCDYPDYDNFLDEYFVDEIYNLQNRVDIPDEVIEIFNEYDNEEDEEEEEED